MTSNPLFIVKSFLIIVEVLWEWVAVWDQLCLFFYAFYFITKRLKWNEKRCIILRNPFISDDFKRNWYNVAMTKLKMIKEKNSFFVLTTSRREYLLTITVSVTHLRRSYQVLLSMNLKQTKRKRKKQHQRISEAKDTTKRRKNHLLGCKKSLASCPPPKIQSDVSGVATVSEKFCLF